MGKVKTVFPNKPPITNDTMIVVLSHVSLLAPVCKNNVVLVGKITVLVGGWRDIFTGTTVPSSTYYCRPKVRGRSAIYSGITPYSTYHLAPNAGESSNIFTQTTVPNSSWFSEAQENGIFGKTTTYCQKARTAEMAIRISSIKDVISGN